MRFLNSTNNFMPLTISCLYCMARNVPKFMEKLWHHVNVKTLFCTRFWDVLHGSNKRTSTKCLNDFLLMVERVGVNWMSMKTQLFCFCRKRVFMTQTVTSFNLCVYFWPFPGSYTFTLFMSFSVLCSLKKDYRRWLLSMFSFSVMTQGHKGASSFL